MKSNIETIKLTIARHTQEGEFMLALTTLKQHFSALLAEQPLEVVKIHFNLLDEIVDRQAIKEALDFYRDLPYISQEFEDLIKHLEVKTSRHFNRNKSTTEIDDDVRTYLTSGQTSFVLKALYLMKKHQFSPLYFIDEIEDSLSREYPENIALEIIPFLQMFGVNQPISINHFGVIKSLDLNTVPQVGEDPLYRRLISHIEGYHRDITIMQMALELARMAHDANYPFGFEEDDVEPLSRLFVYEAKQALGISENTKESLTTPLINSMLRSNLMKKYHLH